MCHWLRDITLSSNDFLMFLVFTLLKIFNNTLVLRSHFAKSLDLVAYVYEDIPNLTYWLIEVIMGPVGSPYGNMIMFETLINCNCFVSGNFKKHIPDLETLHHKRSNPIRFPYIRQ